MYIKSGHDIIYIKQPLNFQLSKVGRDTYQITINYITGYEKDITTSVLSDVRKDALSIILEHIAQDKNCIDISK